MKTVITWPGFPQVDHQYKHCDLFNIKLPNQVMVISLQFKINTIFRGPIWQTHNLKVKRNHRNCTPSPHHTPLCTPHSHPTPSFLNSKTRREICNWQTLQVAFLLLMEYYSTETSFSSFVYNKIIKKMLVTYVLGTIQTSNSNL